MKEKSKLRNRWLNIRLTADEYKLIEKWFETTTSQTISEYARLVLLKKPVIIKYRNQSADEILSEMIRLKNELHAIGNNYNQVVHKLHTLDKIPGIKVWVIVNEKLKTNFIEKANQVSTRLNEILLWLQK